MTHRLPSRAQITRSIGVALGAAALLSLTTVASRADDGDALKILKSMSDYVASQRSFALTFDSDIEVLTVDLQKIQFASSGSLIVDRAVGVRARRTGGYADVELISDSKSVIVYNNPGKTFARIDMPGSFDDVVGLLRTEHLIEIPGADLFFKRSYHQLTKGVVDAKHIGRGVIDGVNASTWPSATKTRTGSFGSTPARVRCHANTSSRASRFRMRRSTRCGSRSC